MIWCMGITSLVNIFLFMHFWCLVFFSQRGWEAYYRDASETSASSATGWQEEGWCLWPVHERDGEFIIVGKCQGSDCFTTLKVCVV